MLAAANQCLICLAGAGLRFVRCLLWLICEMQVQALRSKADGSPVHSFASAKVVRLHVGSTEN